MKLSFSLRIFTAALVLAGIWVGHSALAAEPVGAIVKRGIFDCFTPGLVTKKGKLVQCEASAVAKVADKVFVALDKPLPGSGRASIFRMELRSLEPLPWTQHYLPQAQILAAIKFEAITVTADRSVLIASTAFDRIKSDSPKWDGYNNLLSWPADKTKPIQVISKSERDGVVSSRKLRKKFRAALKNDKFPEGPGYFKIEGLAATPDGRLLFGIRQVGAGYKTSEYTMKIISVPFALDNGKVTLSDDFALVYDQEPPRLAPNNQPVGLSSIEYDPFNDRLYMLTSFEVSNADDEGLGGFLWTLDMADLGQGKLASIVTKRDGKPLLFAHKPEGLAVLDAKHVLVMHDDDRVLGRPIVENSETQFQRLPHQAAYTIVRFD